MSPQFFAKMNRTIKGSRALQLFQTRCSQLIATMAEYYALFLPGKTQEDFAQEIFVNVIGAHDDPRVKNPREIVTLLTNAMLEDPPAHGSEDEKWWTSPSPRGDDHENWWAGMFVSCAYLRRAMAAWQGGDETSAWLYLTDAGYWSGLTVAHQGIQQQLDRTLDTMASQLASLGANARIEKYRPAVDFAHDLVRKKRPENNGWPSRRRAVEAIKNEVLEFARGKGIPLSVDQAGKTIDGWLAKMPDANELFQKKRQGS
ncbi:hypothetical protein L2Y90_07425 [Burkholderia pyrrocinia]|uniref:hypothetical protein n=1 Tax=Burkholderia pyrrocinia TaxID=60550 RepID=UPI00215AE409|nr:hypothetical protein [Burkholderia pyrrocinia]UVE66933.1 hypothetical protein L2Y90_07425 [Burkholderia pyrrocinia]